MEMYTSTFDAATEAVDDLHWLLGGSLEIFYVYRAAICGTLAVRSFGLCRCFFAISLVDVSSSQRLGLALCGRLLARRAVGGCKLLSVRNF